MKSSEAPRFGLPTFFSSKKRLTTTPGAMWAFLPNYIGLATGGSTQLPGHFILKMEDGESLREGARLTAQSTHGISKRGVLEIWDPAQYKCRIVLYDVDYYGSRTYTWQIRRASASSDWFLYVKVLQIHGLRSMFPFGWLRLIFLTPLSLLSQVVGGPLNLALTATPSPPP